MVYGALGLLAGIGTLPGGGPISLSRAFVEFRSALYRDVDYRLEVAQRSDGTTALRISDAGRIALSASLSFRTVQAPAAPVAPGGTASTLRAEAAERSFAELVEGTAVEGSYEADWAATRRLLDRWGLEAGRVPGLQVAAILWTSYFVGMELPGRRALFWRADLRFDDGPVNGGPLVYRAAVAGVDARFDVVRIDAELAAGGRRFATAELRAFVRPPSPRPVVRRSEGESTRAGRRLDGRVALVTGASRGLGAAIAQELVLAGATVYLNYLQSDDEARNVVASLAPSGLAGSLRLVRGDAGSADWCEAFRASAAASAEGCIDLLVCSASPPIRTLGLHPDALPRFDDFVAASLRLVSAPLATFLPAIAERGGQVLVISSGALDHLPPEWPHYVTAKAALEGLATWAAARFPAVGFLVARPPKLLTDQMNTPGGRSGAAPVEGVAARLVAALADAGRRPGSVRLIAESELAPSPGG